jgi:hypothetical protein
MRNHRLLTLGVLGIVCLLAEHSARAADGPATVVTSPNSRTVFFGSPTTFSVTADGTAPLSYQWRKNGAVIGGATLASFTIDSAQPADEGYYTVDVSNSLGSSASNPAELVVDPGTILSTTTNLLTYGSIWKYNQSGANLGTAWKDVGFNDLSWTSGPGLLGVETTPAVYPDTIRTALALGSPQVITYYFRAHFNLPASSVGAVLTSTNLVDDGLVIYLNGVEAGRLRVAAGQTSQTLADNQATEGAPEILELANGSMVAGDNTIAVEVHQTASTSTDVVFGMGLAAVASTRIADTTAPRLQSVASTTNNRVLVIFSERVDPATATDIANYAVNNGITISGAYLTNDSQTVALITSTLSSGTNYQLTVNNVKDRAVTPNTIAANSQATFALTTGAFIPGDVGSPGVATSISAVAGGYNITAGGTNIAGGADQFAFNYQLVAGNFDYKLRVAGLTLADAWSKAGLMARETLQPNSPYAATMATPSASGAYYQFRPTLGAVPQSLGLAPVNYPNTWLRLQRAGNLFTSYVSTDGDAWFQLGSSTINMAGTIYLGMAVSAGVPTNSPTPTVTAQFRDFGTVSGATIATRLNVEPPGPSSRKTPFVITEIMYNPQPAPSSNVLEFVEIYNSNPFFEDISGYRLSGAIDFTFPPNTVLQGGEYRVIARSPSDVQNYYHISRVMGPYTNDFLTSSGRLRLRNKEDAVMLEINYSSDPPWPAGADGAGHSIVLARPTYGEDSPKAWATSSRFGGSPGAFDGVSSSPQQSVRINEFLANSAAQDYIELYNHSSKEVDLSGCTLSDAPHTNKFVIEQGVKIAPRGFLAFTQAQLGFGLASGGETIYFRSADGQQMLDALKFGPQALGVPSGRSPDGADEIYPLTAQTPGEANAGILIRDIVINEIMYKPVSGNDNEEYVELYNRGSTPVNIGGWKFVAGIDYKFPSNTVLAADSYLVVARNVARILTNYPSLSADKVFGNYDGGLGNRGERLALGMPDVEVVTNELNQVRTNTVYVVVDEVTYGTGGNWAPWANEGGSSLELIDPNSDHRLAHNWTDSDETQKAPWSILEFVGPFDNGSESPTTLQVMTLGEGEYLMDDVYLSAQGGPNLCTNGTFETGLSSWTARGSHLRSSIEAGTGFNNSSCMHIRASSRGDSLINRLRVPLSATAPSGGATGIIRAKVRWLKGWPEVVIRTHGNHGELFAHLTIPTNLGTPGARNSRARTNAPPAIYEVRHDPVVPDGNQPVVVTARAHDVNGLATLVLRYRVDPSTSYSSVTMVDNGTGGDALAGDGIFSATIPGQIANTLVAFQITATDTLGASMLFPLQDTTYARPFECLVRFGDPVPSSSFGTYRQWMTADNVADWQARPSLSNERIYGTFVYGNFRAVYNMSVKWAGSPYHQFTGSPVTTAAHYSIDLPLDDTVLGTENFNKIHAPGNGPFDEVTVQREQICYWTARQMRLPWGYRRYVNMYFNGNKRNGNASLMEDSQTPGNDMVSQFFPDDDNGNLYKMQPWFETDDTTAGSVGFRNVAWCALNKFTTLSNGVVIQKSARQRHNYLVRGANGTANDFSAVFALIDAANTSTNGWDALTANMSAVADMDEWFRIFAVEHASGNWDSFGAQNSQNMYGYKPKDGKYTLMIWDWNIVLGNSGSWAAGDNLFVINTQDTRMPYLYANPTFRRMYFRSLKEICNGPWAPGSVDPILDAKYAAIQRSGIAATSPDVIKTYINTARGSILNQVAAEDATRFRITISDNITTNNNVLTITGEAPVEARSLLVNGIAYPITWTSVKAFRIQVPANQATNRFELQGYDSQDRPLANFKTNITFIFTGEIPAPEKSIVLSEIMYNPTTPEASYVELYNNSDFGFELTGWRLNGLDFTFNLGAVLGGRQYAVVAKNRAAFAAAYGANVAPVGEFDGQLDDGGETISLERPTTLITTNGTKLTTNTVFVTVNKVRYDDDAPWPPVADGGGAALQLIDVNQDNSRVSNWSDHEDWRYVTYTGNIAPNTDTNFLVWLNTAGEVYVDDIVLVTGAVANVGINILANGDFESGLDAWAALGNHSNSVVVTDTSHTGNACVKLISQGVGGPTAALRQFIPAFTASTLCTVSYWIRPTTNAGIMTVRCRNGSSFVSTNGVKPTLLTPGGPNTVAAPLPPYDPLWLNELQANNVNGPVDNQGQHEPWLELYNAGPTPLDLSGYFLADNYVNLTQWQFPPGASIAPGEFKLVWADGQPAQSTVSQWHTSFRLNSATGSVALVRLVAGRPQVTDYLNYQNVGADLSYGDFPNGQPFERQTFFGPTPGAPNNGREINVFINEWMAGNTNFLADPADGAFDDWFELYNAGTSTVDLGGYWLTDNLLSPRGFQIPDNGQYTIPAHGFLLVWADGETDQNTPDRVDLHASFQLSRDGEDIGLFAPNGVTLIDGVTFPGQTNNVSQGRFADGAASLYFMTQPSPRAANTLEGGNLPPSVNPIANRVVTLGQTLSFTATATDPDAPLQTVAFSLDPGAPLGASITPGGLFTWTPTPAQAPSQVNIVVRATDNGVPPLSGTRPFTVTVRTPPRTTLGRDGTGNFTVSFDTLSGKTYRVEYKNALSDPNWLVLKTEVAGSASLTVTDDLGSNPQRFYRIVQLD